MIASSGCAARRYRTKLEPMKPEPPVTRSFTAGNLLRPSGQPPSFTSTANHVPDLGSGEVPRQAALVALIGLRREVGVDEIDDATARRRQVLHPVGDAGRNSDEPGGPVTQNEPTMDIHALRLRAHVEQHQEHLVPGRHEPDVRLALVEMERLDGARLHLAVVDLLDLESG